jgi:bleomycin hydrolase
LIHLTGIAKDQDNTSYYKTKNSWTDNSNKFGGYLNMSEAYVKMKIVDRTTHNQNIPKALRKKNRFIEVS